MPRFLALDADAGGLFVASGDIGRGGLTVEQTVAAADDLGPLAPATAAARGTRLKELLAAAAVKPAPLLVLVGQGRVILKDVTHPPTAPAEEPAVVRFQASRELTDAVDELVMDYLPLAPMADGQRRATAAFVRKDVLLAARQLAEAAGLKLLGVTPRPFAAPAALRRAGVTPPAVVVVAWPGGGEFTAVADGRVLFTRPLTSADPEAEVRRNLAVYAGRHPDHPIESLLVADPALAPRLADALALPVQAFDPAAGVPGGDLLAPSLRGRLLAPLALLAQKATADALPLNFAQPRAPRAEPGKNRGRLILAALAAVLLVGMGGLFAYLQLDTAATRVAALQDQKKELQKLIDAQQPAVNRLKAADEFEAREAVVLDELYELARRVPDVSKLTVVEFDLTGKPAAPARKGAATPAPGGKAAAAPVATMKVRFRSADEKLVQRVVDGLNADKRFYGKASFQVAPATEAGSKSVELVVTTDVFRRPPDQYTQVIAGPKAAAPAVAPAPGPAAVEFGEGSAP